MAIVDWFVNLISSIQKMFSNFFTSPLITMGLVALLFLIIFAYALVSSTRPGKRVYSFSETERLCEVYEVLETFPTILKTEQNKKFIRNNLAYNMKEGWKNVTMWLGKRGTAYTFTTEKTPEGKAKKIGSLFDGIRSCLPDDYVASIPAEHIESMKKSEIFVTVELEGGSKPDADSPKISEQDIYSEADMNMANLIGSRIKNVLHREDWIRNFGLIASGIALTYVLNALGILKVS